MKEISFGREPWETVSLKIRVIVGSERAAQTLFQSVRHLTANKNRDLSTIFYLVLVR